MGKNMASRLTEEQRAALVRRYLAGEPSTRLAKEVGCAPSTILDMVTRAGHVTRNRREAVKYRAKPENSGYQPSPEEIARAAAEIREKNRIAMLNSPPPVTCGSPRLALPQYVSRYNGRTKSVVFLPQE